LNIFENLFDFLQEGKNSKFDALKQELQKAFNVGIKRQ